MRQSDSRKQRGLLLSAIGGRGWALLGLTAACLAGATVSPATEDAPAKTAAPATASAPSPDAAGEAVEKLHTNLMAALALPKEKETPVREALAAYRAELAAWSAKNLPEIARLRERMGKYHAAKDAKTMADVKAAMGELNKLLAGRQAMDQALLDRLRKLLTDEQFAKAEAMLNPPPAQEAPTNKFHYLGRLGLTPEQLEKMKTIVEAARKDAPPPHAGGPRRDPMEGAWNRIVKEVLTEKDRARLTDVMREDAHRRMVMAMFKEVRLTPEQTEKIEAIWQKAYKQAGERPQERFQIYSQAQDEAVEKVLTTEQREELSRLRRPAKPPHPQTAPAPTDGGKTDGK